MDKMQYALLTKVSGRAKAEVIESYLDVNEIDAVLVQEAISHLTHPTSFAMVRIYVPKESLKQARELLKKFNETSIDSKEKTYMANKKKIERRLEAQQKAQHARYVQIGGIAVALLVIVFGFWYFSSNAPAAEEELPTTGEGGAPATAIDTSKTYYATFTMENGGEFVIEFFDDQAPVTVNNFVTLARAGYYDGTTFHRVIDGFMAQGGDPTGTGTGGPGYSFEDEIDPNLVFDRAGLLAMANAGPNTNGSQFFITYGPTPHLNGLHTIFGEVIEGMDVVNGITRREPGASIPGDAIETIVITEE